MDVMSLNCKDASPVSPVSNACSCTKVLVNVFFWSKVQKNVPPAWLTNRLIYGFVHLNMFLAKFKKEEEEEKLMNDVSLDWTPQPWITHVVSFIHAGVIQWNSHRMSSSSLPDSGQLEEMISVWPFCSLTNSSAPLSDVLRVTMWWTESKWAGCV